MKFIGFALFAGPIFFSIFVARFVFKSGQKAGFGQICFDIFEKKFEKLVKKRVCGHFFWPYGHF